MGVFMIALRISEIKLFMNQLLCTETFDHFLLQDATIQKDATYTIDGRLNPDYYSAEELEELSLTGLSHLPFFHLRTHCFDLIKGNAHRLILNLYSCSRRKILSARSRRARPVLPLPTSRDVF